MMTNQLSTCKLEILQQQTSNSTVERSKQYSVSNGFSLDKPSILSRTLPDIHKEMTEKKNIYIPPTPPPNVYNMNLLKHGVTIKVRVFSVYTTLIL
jgi:hypothetical protein